MRNFFIFLLAICVCPLPLSAASDKAPAVKAPAQKAPTSSQEMTRKNIRDAVRTQRNQRFDEMPYLDKTIVREMIKKGEVESSIQFTSTGKDKVLEDYILRALHVHTEARAAWERVALTRRRILVAVRNLFPEAKFEFGERDGKLSGEKFNSLDYRFTFKQPVFRGGALWNSLLQEKASLEGAEYKYDSIIGNLIRDVSKAYFEYHRSKKVVEDQQKIIDKMKPLAEISEQKFKQDIVSEIEHLHSQSLFGEIQYDHETAKQELELAKIELQKYVNINTDEPVQVVPLYDTKKFLSMSLDADKSTSAKGTAPIKNEDLFRFAGDSPVLKIEELSNLAYQHRPELRMEAAKLESARFAEKARWGSFMPQVDVVLEFGKLAEAFDVVNVNPGLRKEFRFMVEVGWNVGGNKVKYGFDKREDAPTVSEFQGSDSGTGREVRANTISAGILDGLDDFVRVKEAQIEKLDQIVELEKAEKEVIQEVKKAYFDYKKAQIQAQSSLQNINYLQRSSQVAEHKLEKNEIQVSEYLKAQIDLAEGLGKFHRALADFMTARAELNHAIGVPDYLKFGDNYES